MLANKIRVALQKAFLSGKTPIKILVHPALRDGLRHELSGTMYWHKDDYCHYVFELPLQAVPNVFDPIVMTKDDPTFKETERAERCRKLFSEAGHGVVLSV